MSLTQGTRRALMRPNRKGARYFVDATGGNDANDGRSPAQAWQTIGQVNGATFLPGDSILFKRGETWTGTQLLAPSSGSAGNVITFGAYGAGNDPIIDGNDTVDCINANSEAYIVFENIRATQGLDFGFNVGGSSNNITIEDCEADNCGNDNIVILGAGVHDVVVRRVDSHDAYQRVGGVVVTCIEIADGAYNVTVSDSEFYSSANRGCSIHSHAATDFPYNIVFRDCSFHSNTSAAFGIQQDNAVLSVADANILISNCTFNDSSGDGIYLTDTGDPWPTGIVFDNCEAVRNTSRSLTCQARNVTFRRCVFHSTLETYFQACQDITAYNCVFYRVASVAVRMLGALDGVLMRNCIIASEGIIPIRVNTTTNVDLDYNLYFSYATDITAGAAMEWGATYYTWANWKTNSGGDSNSPTPANPTFTDAANDDFTLQAGSPAIDAGVDVGLAYLGTAPDCGAYEKA